MSLRLPPKKIPTPPHVVSITTCSFVTASFLKSSAEILSRGQRRQENGDHRRSFYSDEEVKETLDHGDLYRRRHQPIVSIFNTIFLKVDDVDAWKSRREVVCVGQRAKGVIGRYC